MSLPEKWGVQARVGQIPAPSSLSTLTCENGQQAAVPAAVRTQEWPIGQLAGLWQGLPRYPLRAVVRRS